MGAKDLDSEFPRESNRKWVRCSSRPHHLFTKSFVVVAAGERTTLEIIIPAIRCCQNYRSLFLSAASHRTGMRI